jgi:acyl phosphate:glycerol-3-phosphate acyltransferase
MDLFLGILKFIGLCVMAYFLGATPYSYIFPKLIKGVDVRKDGTGNVGISNAFLVGGKVPGIFAFIFDHFKPMLAMLLAYFIGGWTFNGGFDLHNGGIWNMLILTIFVMIGHDFPVFLKFKGGKGLCVPYGSILFLGPLYWIAGNFSLILFLFPKNKNTKFRIANIQVIFLMLLSGILFYLETFYWKGTWFAWRFPLLLGEKDIITIPIAIFSIVWSILYMSKRLMFTGLVKDIKDGISPFRAVYLRALFEMYPRESKTRNPGKEIQMGEDDYKEVKK